MRGIRTNYSIYSKYLILNAVDEMGESEFFDRTGDRIVKSKSSLKQWRIQLMSVVLPLPKGEHFKQALMTVPGYYERLIGLARKDFLVNVRGPQDLSNFIQPIFNKKITGAKLTKSENKNLYLKGLIDECGFLTRLGVAQKLSSSSCRKQCIELNVPYSKLDISTDAACVELSVIRYLNETTEINWFYIENGIYELFIRKMLSPICQKLGIKPYYHCMGVVDRDLETQFLGEFTEDYFHTYVRSIESSGTIFQDVREPKFSTMDADDVAIVYRAFGYDRFLSIIKHDFIEPNVYARGWPDLLGLDGQDLKFLEVKRTDNLTISQIETFPRIVEMGFEVEVVMVQTKRPQPFQPAIL